MRKKAWIFLLAAVLVMSLAGCGSSEDAAGTETAEEAGAEEAEPADSEDAEAALEGLVEESATFDNIEDFVELGDYKALSIVRQEDIVTDGYPEGIGELVGYRLTYPEVDYGLTVTMDYVGEIDGAAFEGGSAENADLKIGSHSFIDDFEDQLVGAKPDDVVKVTVTFPEDYHAEQYAGKEAVFTCTIHSVWKDLWEGVVEQCTVKQYPKDLYETMLATVRRTNEKNASNYGMTVEEYIKAAGLPEESEQAFTETKWALVNRGLLKDLGITEDSEAYKAMEKTVLTASGYEDMDAAIAAGLTESQVDITTEYYAATQALLREHGLID